MKEEGKAILPTLIVDQLYSDLKERIIRGQLKPDEKLSVRTLCEYYKVSDTPVKQALNRLAAERFVDALPRRGMRVRCVSLKDIHEALEARQMIELFAVPHAIRLAGEEPGFLEALEENLEKNRQLLEDLESLSHYSEKAEQELAVSQDFHRILVKAVGNSVILDSYENILAHQYVYYQHQKDKRRELMASLREHRQILDYLKAGDGAAVREAIITHLRYREEDVSAVMDSHAGRR